MFDDASSALRHLVSSLFKLVLVAGALGMLGAVFVLNQKVEDLDAKLAHHEAHVRSLQFALARQESTDVLQQRFILANQKTIESLQPKRTLTVTAYSPRKRETDATPFHTASNRKVRNGIVAVSRDLFAQGWVFGKKVYLKGMGVFVIDDLMAEEKRQQIDIFMFDTDKALRFGKRTLDAYLLDLEPLDRFSAISRVSSTLPKIQTADYLVAQEELR